MEKIFLMTIFISAFVFFAGGICVANSIEAKESKTVENVLTFLTILGLIGVGVGIIGMGIITLIN